MELSCKGRGWLSSTQTAQQSPRPGGGHWFCPCLRSVRCVTLGQARSSLDLDFPLGNTEMLRTSHPSLPYRQNGVTVEVQDALRGWRQCRISKLSILWDQVVPWWAQHSLLKLAFLSLDPGP